MLHGGLQDQAFQQSQPVPVAAYYTADHIFLQRQEDRNIFQHGLLIGQLMHLIFQEILIQVKTLLRIFILPQQGDLAMSQTQTHEIRLHIPALPQTFSLLGELKNPCQCRVIPVQSLLLLLTFLLDLLVLPSQIKAIFLHPAFLIFRLLLIRVLLGHHGK